MNEEPGLKARQQSLACLALSFFGFVVGDRVVDAVVDSAGGKVGFKLRVDKLRVTLVEPPIKLFDLQGYQRVLACSISRTDFKLMAWPISF